MNQMICSSYLFLEQVGKEQDQCIHNSDNSKKSSFLLQDKKRKFLTLAKLTSRDHTRPFKNNIIHWVPVPTQVNTMKLRKWEG